MRNLDLAASNSAGERRFRPASSRRRVSGRFRPVAVPHGPGHSAPGFHARRVARAIRRWSRVGRAPPAFSRRGRSPWLRWSRSTLAARSPRHLRRQPGAYVRLFARAQRPEANPQRRVGPLGGIRKKAGAPRATGVAEKVSWRARWRLGTAGITGFLAGAPGSRPTPSFFRMISRGQKLVKDDCSRLKPTKAVNQSQYGCGSAPTTGWRG